MAEAEYINPFKDLKISSWDPLRNVSRAPCPKCHCSRKFYCYTCYEVVGVDPQTIPKVRLPVTVDIIKHPAEVPGKSTATHARILAPEDVTIHIYPTVPVYPDPSTVVLVYPKEDALSTSELALRMKQQREPSVSHSWRPLERVVFVDSTWQQSHGILSDAALKSLTTVKLTNANTYFWRPQRKTSSHLATIEALYYFFREMAAAVSDRPYDGEFDDLLYFYAYQYGVVQQAQKEKESYSERNL